MANRVELPIVVLNDQSPYNPIEGATATILNRSDSSEATVYTDSGATNDTITQPLSTDEAGRLTGWMDRGAYEIQIVIPGGTPYSEEFDAAPGSDGAVTTNWIADGAITGVKVSSAIKDASTGTASLRTLGTGAVQAAAGNDPRLSDARTPLDGSVTTAKIVDGAVTKAKLGADAAGVVPSGGLIAYAGSVAPTGWLLCDGSSKLRSDYPSLFTAIGTTYGSVDGTHFNLPDGRGNTLVGVDSGAGRITSSNTLGSKSGAEKHILSASELAQHQHDVNDPGHNHGITEPNSGKGHTHTYADGQHNHPLGTLGTRNNGTGGSFNYYGPGGGVNTGSSNSNISINLATTGITIDSGGTGLTVGNIVKSVTPDQGHNNLQPYLVINWIIKT